MSLMRSSCLVFALSLAACDGLSGPAPPATPPAPAPVLARPVQDLQTYAGRNYADLVAAYPSRFGSEALGISASDAQRIHVLTQRATGAMLDGGGAQALVFRGCAATGCADGVAIVAVDGATGAAFVGVRDSAGKDLLVPNDRLEALLRLNAATRDWPDAGAGETEGAPAAEPERP